MSAPRAGQPPTGSAPEAPGQRLPAVDAVRAGAMLLGVVLHACAPYMHVHMGGLVMPVQEPAPSRAPDIVFWLLHAFRVPAFFVVAGCVARLLLARRGPAEFLRNRWRRVGIVLLVAYPVVTLAMYPTWLWGWVARGWAGWGHLFALKYGPDLQRAVWGFNQLWFLEYLLVYCLALWAWERWRTRRAPEDQAAPAPLDAAPSPARQRVPGFLNIAVPIACVTLWPAWYVDFRNAYLPHPPALVYYAMFFLLGVRLSRAGFDALARVAPLLLLAGLALAAPYLKIIFAQVRETMHGQRQGVPEALHDRVLLALASTGIAFAWSLGWLGLAARVVGRPGRLARFLIDASYWVYLTHLVWIGLGVMLLHRFVPPGALGPEARAALVAGFAAALSLATFAPVRSTRLGRWLGSRQAGATAPRA